MAGLRRWFHRLYASLRPGASDRSLERELGSHLALLEERLAADDGDRREDRGRRNASRCESLAMRVDPMVALRRE